ncbi:MAG: cytochrome c-type biogenesis protein [Moraxellaceae bacterium]
MKKLLLLLIFVVFSAHASIEVFPFESPEQEQRFRHLIDELRCPKCQNQNLSGSDAEVARDLKRRAWELMQQGKTDDEIRAYLVDRYGDFITYRPPLRANTFLLWFGPLLLFFSVAAVLVWRVRRKPVNTAPLSDDERKKLAALLDDSNPTSRP